DTKGTVLARHPDPEKWVGQSVPDTRLTQTLSGGRTGTAETEGLDGIRRLYAFTPIGDGASSGNAFLAYGIDSRLAFAEVDRLRVRNLIGLGLVTILAVAAAWAGGNVLLLRHVNALVSAARRISTGDLSARTGVPRGRGELNELAGAFDDMAASLQMRQTEAERAAHALGRFTHRLKGLHEIDKGVLRSESPEAIADAALRHVGNLIPSRMVNLFLFDFDAQEVRILAVRDTGGIGPMPGTRIPLESLGAILDGLTSLQEGDVYVLDLQAQPAPSLLLEAARAQGVGTLHIVPLIVRGHLIGALSLGLERADGLAPEHLDIARELSDQMAVAIHQAQLREDLRGHVEELEQHVAERTATLRETMTFLEHLIATSPGIIYRRRPSDLVITYISGNVQRLLGYAPQEIIGVPKFWLQRIHPNDRDRLEAMNERAWADRQVHAEREYRFRHQDGQYRWLHTVVRYEYDQAGSLIDVLGFAMDITDRKRAEEALQEARNEADRANQAKSEFLSRMSHELRTPLNAVLGFAQILEMDSLDAEQREGVSHILRAGRHLLELINEVLDIARVEAGRLAISLEAVPVTEVLQEVVDLIRPLAASESIRLMADASGGPGPHILADRQRVKQVLLNLLSNAIKYNRQNGSVALFHHTSPEGRLRISVSDSGYGIVPGWMQELFIPFERLGAEQTAIEGTGLGLALSKRLVEVMGGTLGVESTVGQGSVFWVEFPLAEDPVKRLDQEGRDLPALVDREEAPASRGVLDVLYIEDNLSNLKLIEYLMAHRPDVKLIPAMQGRLGLDIAREHHPDLILLDLHLPDIPGAEVLRRLRQSPETSEIPVVVITADATPSHLEPLLAAGARAYLTKPLDVKKFLETMDEVLRDARSGRALTVADA
ncbi:MAG TPA: ATP-binding protein, partial [Chloroflexota bacterium]